MTKKSASHVSSMNSYRKRKMESKIKKAGPDVEVSWGDCHALIKDISGLFEQIAKGIETIRGTAIGENITEMEEPIRKAAIKGYLAKTEFDKVNEALGDKAGALTEDDYPAYYEVMHTLTNRHSIAATDLAAELQELHGSLVKMIEEKKESK